MTCQFHMISAELKSRSLKKCFIEYKNRRKLFCSQGVKMYYFVKVKLKTIQSCFQLFLYYGI